MPVSTLRIFRLALPVSDIERAAAFYTALLGAPGRRIAPNRHYFDCGGVILACVDPRGEGNTSPFQPNPDYIYFSAPDLESALTRARTAGANIYTIDHAPIDGAPPRAASASPPRKGDPIQVQPWGERSFYCKDPFENRLCFVDETTLFTARRPGA